MRHDETLPSAVVWRLIVPLKPLARAKSRLGHAAGDASRPMLALAFAQDTVRAALESASVGDVVVVTDDPVVTRELSALGARVLSDTPAAGLNEALTHGARAVRTGAGEVPVAALGADLPALRAAELTHVLAAASEFPRAFLPDAVGRGTTLLTALPGHALAPAFGGPSRSRHRASGAVELRLRGVASVRRDVDTAADLSAALALGVGPHTVRVATRRLPLMQATSYTYDPDTRSGSVLLDDGTPLAFDAAAFDAGGLRLLRPGQRVRVEVEGEGDQRQITLVTLQTM